MKQKYTILKEAPTISMQEIRNFKSFDVVLDNHSNTVPGLSKLKLVKGFSAIVFASTLGYFLMPNTPQRPATNIAALSPKQIEITFDEIKLSSTLLLEKQIVELEVPKKLEPKNTKKQKPLKASNVKQKPEIKSSANLKKNTHIKAKPVAGFPELYLYFENELTYPKSAIPDSIEGTVKVSFYINKDGSINKIEVLQSLSKDLDKEAIRVIQNMPEWQPASVNNIPIGSKMSIPLSFHIEKKP